MEFITTFDKFRNNKTGQRAVVVNEIGLDYQIAVLNEDTGKSRKRWVSYEKLTNEWSRISNSEYWD